MGYYSDVNVAMRVKDYRALLAKVKENAEKIEGLDWLMKQAEVNYNVPTDPRQSEEEQTVVLGWYGMKWYDDALPNVKFIMDFINQLDEVNFIRIGEDETDTERIEIGDRFFDMFYVHRSIEIY